MHLTLNTPYTVPGQLDPVQTFEKKCIINNDLYTRIHNQSGNDVEIIESGRVGNQYLRDAIVHPRPEAVPGAIKVFIGSDALDFRERTTYDLQKHLGVTESSLLGGPLKGKVTAKTTFSIRSAAPFNPRGVVHVLDADIQAKIWLIGGQLEKTMGKEIKAKQPEIQKTTQTALDAITQAERSAA